MTIVVCKYCKTGSKFLDDAMWGFDCKQCGKHNKEGTYRMVDDDE